MQAHGGVKLHVPWPLTGRHLRYVPQRDFEQHLQAALAHNPHRQRGACDSSDSQLPISIELDLQALDDSFVSMLDSPSEVTKPGQHFNEQEKHQQSFSMQLSEDQKGESQSTGASTLAHGTDCRRCRFLPSST